MDRRQIMLGLGAGALGFARDTRNARAASNLCSDCPPYDPTPLTGPDYGGLAFEWIRFSKTGALINPSAPALLRDPTLTDIIVISHGWKTDEQGAHDLYNILLRKLVTAFAARAPSSRKFGVLGVQWPSKQFRDEQTSPVNQISGRQRSATQLTGADVRRAVEQYAAFTGGDASRLMAAAQAFATQRREQDYWALAEEIQAPLSAPGSDAELLADAALFAATGDETRRSRHVDLMLRNAARAPLAFDFDPSVASAQGIAPRQYARYRGIAAFILDQLNLPTYFDMKTRAGVVGGGLANSILRQIETSSAARVHLIGHSFGARVVTSAAFHAPGQSKLRSLTLLQGAFSQYGMAANGAFASAYKKVSGPTLITRTHNDEAVSLYYAIASAAAGDTSRVRAKLGGPDDPHGGIGANGALNLPSADVVALTDANASVFSPGKVHNVTCDQIIHCHMDVTNASVATMVAAALAV